MPADVTIRPAEPEEYERLGELTVAAYAALPGTPTSAEYAELLRDVLARAADSVVLVAVDSAGTLLGGVTYVPGPGPLAQFDGPDEAGMRMLAVSPQAQGGGIGRRLVQACIDRAVADGRDRIVLHTTPVMTAAHSLYESSGFVRDPARDFDAGTTRLLAYTLELTPG